jgi:hypothetical protein
MTRTEVTAATTKETATPSTRAIRGEANRNLLAA